MAVTPVPWGILSDLVDSVWSDRPALLKDKAWKLPKTITGETIDQKLKRLRDEMKANELGQRDRKSVV